MKSKSKTMRKSVFEVQAEIKYENVHVKLSKPIQTLQGRSRRLHIQEAQAHSGDVP